MKHNQTRDRFKASKKANRDEEIEFHGKPANHASVHKNAKKYTRKHRVDLDYE